MSEFLSSRNWNFRLSNVDSCSLTHIAGLFASIVKKAAKVINKAKFFTVLFFLAIDYQYWFF